MKNDKDYTENSNFGKIRSFIWPVHRHELKKILPLFCLFFLISFVYHLLRCMKITIVVKAPGSGAEIIPFLKVWLVLPAAIAFTYLYTKLAGKYNRMQIFTIIVTIFASFFAIFALFLYPNQETLGLNYISNTLQNILPTNLKAFSLLFLYWPSAIFYVMSEMWSIVVLSMLFWGFTNEITKVSEAKRFYALIALGANCAGIISGQSMQLLTTDSWYNTVSILITTVIICCALMLVLFYWINNTSLNNQQEKISIKQKNKVSLKKSFEFLFQSKYAIYLTLIVLTYNVVSNLSDVLWTDQVHRRFTDPLSLNTYMARLDSLVGCFSVAISLIVFSNVIRKFGWTITAILTPIIWLITTVMLFSGLFMESNLLDAINFIFFSMPINELILVLGTLQISLGRASKYTLFDQTKEIAFIPLSVEHQRKGKTIVDGIASRFGKSGSSVSIQIMLLFCGGKVANAIPYMGIIIAIAILVWSYATYKLGLLISEQNIKSDLNNLEKDSNSKIKNNKTSFA